MSLVATILALYATQIMLRFIPSVIYEEYTLFFHISDFQYSFFIALFYLAYATFQIPVGFSLDILHPKISIPTLIVCLIAGLLLTVQGVFYVSLAGRFISGVGATIGVVGVSKILKMFFSEKRYNQLFGFTVAFCLLFTACFNYVSLDILKQYNWQTLFYSLVVVQVVVGVYLLSIIGKSRKTEPKKTTTMLTMSSFLKTTSSLLQDRAVLPLLLASGCMIGTIAGFADSWGIQYFKLREFSGKEAMLINSGAFIGMACGSLFFTMLFKKMKHYYNASMFMGVALFLNMMVLLSGVQLPLFAHFLLLFSSGVCSSYHVLLYLLVANMVGGELAITAKSLLNSFTLICGFLFHLVAGFAVIVIKASFDSFSELGSLETRMVIIAFFAGVGALCLLANRKHALSRLQLLEADS
jgi:MFS family permease